MTVYTAALTGMRAQISAQIVANGVACDVLRFSGSTDGSGRKTGSYGSIMSGSTEQIWVQPYSIARGGSAVMQAQGILGETTHIGYQAKGGKVLFPKDRIMAAGETYAYDVVDQQEFDTHYELLLKQVRRV